jgi:hypothetical protein
MSISASGPVTRSPAQLQAEHERIRQQYRQEFQKQVPSWHTLFECADALSQLGSDDASFEAKKLFQAAVDRGYRQQTAYLHLGRIYVFIFSQRGESVE